MDVLRMAVAPTPSDAGGGFHVEVDVNEVEMTAAGAGLGMDPYDVLVPTNRFEHGAVPVTVPVARCGCGVYGCGATDVTITREGDVVRWSWEVEVPMARDVTFDVAEYVREIRRVASDHSWETPERTAGRLVLSSVAAGSLAGRLRISWVANDWRNPALFRVCLQDGHDYQVFVDVEWLDRTPEELAAEVRRLLLEVPPGEWRATWHAIQRSDRPPDLAGPGWRREQY